MERHGTIVETSGREARVLPWAGPGTPPFLADPFSLGLFETIYETIYETIAGILLELLGIIQEYY